jgi:hypothetical protein
LSLSPVLEYDTSIPGDTYPLWDGKFQHSISAGRQGRIHPALPRLYCSRPATKSRCAPRVLLSEIAVVPEAVDVMSFSYAGELAAADVAIVGADQVPGCGSENQAARDCGRAPGTSARNGSTSRSEHLAEIAAPFRALGASLEALGMRLGTSLVLELMANGKSSSQPTTRGRRSTSCCAARRHHLKMPTRPDIKAVANTWIGLSDERRALASAPFSDEPEPGPGEADGSIRTRARKRLGRP